MPRHFAPLAFGAACVLAAGAAAGEPGVARQGELLHLLRHDFGSCHGMSLKGGLGLPLVPETLAGRDRDALIETVLEGRRGTPMPPFAFLLTAEEAAWLVDRLLAGADGG